MAIDEHFSPDAGLDLDEYVRRGDRNGAGHLIRYLWAAACLGDAPAGRVLDLGCGAGYGTFLLARECPDVAFLGVDYDPEAVAEARSRFALPNLRFASGDALRWDETIGEERWDAIVAFDAVEHVPHREIFMSSLVDHLEDDGRLLFSTPCGHASPILTPAWEHHEIEYSPATLYDLLARYFGTILRPENGSLPRAEVFGRLHGTGMEYFLLLNPVVCEKPLRIENPFSLGKARSAVDAHRPFAGDWGAWGRDMPGLFDWRTGLAYLFTPPACGGSLQAVDIGARGPHWYPVAGDWSGLGIDGVGAVDVRSGDVVTIDRIDRPAERSAARRPELAAGGIPVAGDWDGDGRDAIGLFVPETRVWTLPGHADVVFGPDAGSLAPVAGRWESARGDSIGVYVRETGTFFLRHAPTAGPADVAFSFGLPGARPIAGDWDGDGTAGVGVWSVEDRMIYLRDRHEPGAADAVVAMPSAIG